jgi:ankyrin repeat protein
VRAGARRLLLATLALPLLALAGLLVLFTTRARPGTPLARAAHDGDLPGLLGALEAGADPRAPDGTGQAALHWAARGGSLAVVDALLDAGADVDQPDARASFAWTPLIAAVHSDRWELAEHLLDRGAAPDRPAVNGATPLLHACGAEPGAARDALVRRLLAEGVDPRAASEDGATPLVNAVLSGSRDVVEALLSADPSLRWPEGAAAARFAARVQGHGDLLDLVDTPRP